MIRNDGFTAVDVTVDVRARHASHADGLSIHRCRITVSLRCHVAVRLPSQSVLERFERVTSVDPFHGGLPSLVEHLPHLANN